MQIMSQAHRSINSLYYEKSTYESSPNARNIIENNQVKIINYRGRKLTSFYVDHRQLICLPQAFDYFLKNFVGGLHTVYTKLKRLEILPVVCNVEQVRILRSLGSIQPGVNRCKLLAPNEFDILYEDCTNSGCRPGRPPKRNLSHQIDDYSENKHHLFNSSIFTPPLHLSNNFRTNESKSFTIDAMLSNTRDHLTKSIDQSITTIEQTSSILSRTTSMDFFHIKNMIELTIANSYRREKELENVIVDLKDEIIKEHDCKQKLEEDFIQLRRVRSILIKKLKRLNRSKTCSYTKKSSSNTSTIQ